MSSETRRTWIARSPRVHYPLALSTVALALLACGGENTDSQVASPGRATSAETQALEAGAQLLQDKTPLRTLNAYLDGFHFYSGDLRAQMEAHHYCGHVNEDLIQCVIFDGNGEDAKIMGIEYIVSKGLFEQLAADEKHLWHSHAHEVRSGMLIAPGIPDVAEHELMEKLASTYGKTWHTWHTDRKLDLPIGVPQLMMGFTQDGQVDEQRVAARDRRFGVSSLDKRRERADIAAPTVDPEANAWEKGVVVRLEASRNEPSSAAQPSH
jgi:hypothetical protein